jgi:hypothetical protein
MLVYTPAAHFTSRCHYTYIKASYIHVSEHRYRVACNQIIPAVGQRPGCRLILSRRRRSKHHNLLSTTTTQLIKRKIEIQRQMCLDIL